MATTTAAGASPPIPGCDAPVSPGSRAPLTTQPAPARRVVTAYLAWTSLSTLAASVIWAVTTLFLLESGLDIFWVMLVGTAFTAGQVVFEVPTGVVADTIGRKASVLISVVLLMVSTLLYVAAGRMGAGLWGFIAASVLLALGWTFQTGAVDAWLVDALDHTGFAGPKDHVFARGGAATNASMLLGTLLGGLLGQFDLAWPFYARSVLLVGCAVLVPTMMRDLGFSPRPLQASTFAAETKKVLAAGVRYGWRHPVVKPLMFQTFLGGAMFFYSFYSLQPFLLQMLGRQLVWVAAGVTAAGSLAGIGGNAVVSRVMSRGRRPARVLALMTALDTCAVVFAATIGILFLGTPGVGPLLAVAAAWCVSSFLFGITGPVRQTYLNANIPSSERATIISLDALFGDAGAAAGQPGLGWVSRAISIPAGWLVGAALLGASVPLYLLADRRSRGIEAGSDAVTMTGD